MQTTINEATCMGCALRVVFDCVCLDLPSPEGVGGFGNRHAFTGAGIEDAQGAGGRY